MSQDTDLFFNPASNNFSEYALLFNNIPFAVIISDTNDLILFANNQAVKWLNLNTQAEDDVCIKSVFGKNYTKWQQLRAKLNVDASASFRANYGTAEIKEIDLFCKKIVFHKHQLFISYIRDISTQKLLEADLLNEKAERQLILDSIPAMVFVKDTENRILSMNRAYRELTGLEMEMVAGKNVIQFMENLQLAEDYWKDDLEVIETGLPKRNIIEPMITDERRWFITDKIPYRNQDGKIKGIIGFSIDITERKNAEDALMRSERRFRLLFDSSPDGIAISNLQGKILNTNTAFRNLLKYDANELTNLCFRDITPDIYENSEQDFISSAIYDGMVSKMFEKEYISKDKFLIPVNVTCWILFDDAGKPHQLVVAVKDLSYQKKAEQLERSLLQKEKEQLEKDLQTKTQQLNSKITQLIEKNQLVNNVVGQLEKLRKSDQNQIAQNISSIIRDLKNNTNEDFWLQFETTFGQINQSFYDNIYKAFPNLTNNERKISAFLKMNLATKDIANITHQSIRSIEMARARLRAKLNLSRRDNLTKFLNQF